MSTKKSVAFWLFLGCGLVTAAFVAFVAFILVVVFGAMRSSQPYKDAYRIARNDPAVRAVLGSPIEAGYLVSGSINTKNDTGDVDLTVPLTGPKGKGSVHVVGTKANGVWTYTLLQFTPKDGQPIDLPIPTRRGAPGG